jgi:hypothetical protein
MSLIQVGRADRHGVLSHLEPPVQVQPHAFHDFGIRRFARSTNFHYLISSGR